MFLIIKHIDIEGPGSIVDYFRGAARRLFVVDLSSGDSLPKSLDNIEGVIFLGGPMNVYEEDKYPFLQEEDKFLKEAINEEAPILGICLGAQLLSKACGAKVKPAAHKEIGCYKVNLTDEGRQDPIFRNLPGEFNVFQWHQDTFEIPKEGKLLATSDSCVNQAFRFGKNAYGLQFHVEVTPEIVDSWIAAYAKDDKTTDFTKIRSEFKKIEPSFSSQAKKLYSNFLKII